MQSKLCGLGLRQPPCVRGCVVSGGGESWSLWRRSRTRSRPVVAVAPVTRGAVISAVYASGSVEVEGRVDVKARVGGPIKRLFVREGEAVQSDQLLALIDTPLLESELALKESELSAAYARTAPRLNALRAQERSLVAQRDQAQRELARLDEMVARGVSSLVDAERARVKLRMLQEEFAANLDEQSRLRVDIASDTRRAESELRSIQVRVNDAELRAPMAGIVLARYVELGELVEANQDLFRVGDPARLWVEAIVDEMDIRGVRVGRSAVVRVAGFEQTLLDARVVDVHPEAARDRKGFRVDLEFIQRVEGLRPGATAECNIVLERHEQALLAPLGAIRDDLAWLVDRDGTVHRRSVELGLRDLDAVEITRGLELGNIVVVGSGSGLSDGAKVNTRSNAHAERR
jgi:HlyD family secretion protein